MSSTLNQRNWFIYITAIVFVINNLTLPTFCGTLIAIGHPANGDPDILYHIDSITHNLQSIDSVDEDDIIALGYDCANQIMYASQGHGARKFFQFDYLTGAVDGAILDYVTEEDYSALAFGGSTLYGWSIGDFGGPDALGFRIIDPSTADDSTVVFEESKFLFKETQIGGLTYDICNDIMYGITTTSDQESLLFSIDLDTGMPCFIGSTQQVGIGALAFDGINGVLYGSGGRFNYDGDVIASNPGALFTINVETGEATEIMQIVDGNVDALAFVTDSGECPRCTSAPTSFPSSTPTSMTNNPSKSPTNNPSKSPTNNPSKSPTNQTNNPTKKPTIDDVSDDVSN